RVRACRASTSWVRLGSRIATRPTCTGCPRTRSGSPAPSPEPARAPPPEPSASAGAPETLDRAVGLRVRVELLERDLEHLGRLILAAAASERHPEIRDHLSLVLLLAELAEDRRRLLEELERRRVVGAVERER